MPAAHTLELQTFRHSSNQVQMRLRAYAGLEEKRSNFLGKICIALALDCTLKLLDSWSDFGAVAVLGSGWAATMPSDSPRTVSDWRPGQSLCMALWATRKSEVTLHGLRRQLPHITAALPRVWWPACTSVSVCACYVEACERSHSRSAHLCKHLAAACILLASAHADPAGSCWLAA